MKYRTESGLDLENRVPEIPRKTKKRFPDRKARDRMVFMFYDKDGDGSISQVEFDDLYAHLAAQAPKMAPRAARRSAGGNTSRI